MGIIYLFIINPWRETESNKVNISDICWTKGELQFVNFLVSSRMTKINKAADKL